VPHQHLQLNKNVLNLKEKASKMSFPFAFK